MRAEINYNCLDIRNYSFRWNTKLFHKGEFKVEDEIN